MAEQSTCKIKRLENILRSLVYNIPHAKLTTFVYLMIELILHDNKICTMIRHHISK